MYFSIKPVNKTALIANVKNVGIYTAATAYLYEN